MGWRLVAFAILPFVYFSVLSIYRLFFHPLSKYPGPRLAAITNWYAAFYVGRGELHTQTRSWHAKYGPTIRTGPNSICFNTHRGFNDVYGLRANVCKAEGYAAMSASKRSPNTITAIEKEVYRFKRRVQGQFYSEQGLKGIEERVLSRIRTFIDLLGSRDEMVPVEEDKKAWGPTRNMADTCDWLTFDIITDLCYGDSFDMLHSPRLRWFPSVMQAISWRGMMCVIQTKMYKWKIDQIFLAPAYKKILSAGTWTYQRAAARVAQGNDVKDKDLFYNMMNAKDPKTGMHFTLKDLWLESILLLAAGSDSTSTAMSSAFFYLAHYPEARSRATAEVRNTFVNEDDIHMGAELNSCKFLQSCVNEAMRLAPSVPNVLPRYVQPGGLTADDHFIPEGTIVGTAIYSLHRNEDYFPSPDEFRPQRWIVDEKTGVTEESIKQAQLGFYPFSTGPRSCIGWRLAWTELNVMLARTLFRYDMQLAPEAPCCKKTPVGVKCDFSMKGYAVAAVDGPLVQFKGR